MRNPKAFCKAAVPLCILLGAALPVLLISRASPQAQLGDPEKGREDFVKMCAECHGEDAQGDGPDHTQFMPDPANLTLVRLTPAMAYSVVKDGVPGTAMETHPQVTEDTFRDVYAYIQSQPPDTNIQWAYPWLMTDALTPDNEGRAIYLTACADCHGKDGGGDGLWAANNPYVWPKPANFHARSSDEGRLYYITSYGREGTMMAPQEPKFPASARWSVTRYIHSLYDPNSTATIPTGKMERYKNPYSPSNQNVVQQGKDTFDLYCVGCHNASGQGSFLAPMLIDRKWRYGGGTDNAVFVVVTEGIPGKLMPSHKQLEPDRRWAVITYLRHMGGLPDPLAGE